MQWYFAENGKSVGPYADADFQGLAASGRITPQTLVWHEGMATWEPYSKVAGGQPAVPGAAVQPQAATGVCAECGKTFPTSEMVPYEGSMVCASCKPLFFQRIQEGSTALGNTPNKELMAQARASLTGNWGTAIGILVVAFLINMAIGFIPFGLGNIASIIVAGPFALGYAIFYLAVTRADNPEFSMMFDGFKNFGTSLAANILMGLLLFAWSLPAIACIIVAVVFGMAERQTLMVIMILLSIPAFIPFVLAAYAYSMTFYIIADDATVGPLEAIRKSVKMMRGRRWKLFCLGLRFIGWTFLCMLTLFIGFLWLAPYMYASFACFYDDVKGRAAA